jgi:hypothetical protein
LQKILLVRYAEKKRTSPNVDQFRRENNKKLKFNKNHIYHFYYKENLLAKGLNFASGNAGFRGTQLENHCTKALLNTAC